MARSSLHPSVIAVGEEPNVQLTPLLDVVFVVLIMFIVIAPLVEIEQITLASAGGATKSLSQASEVTLRVHKDNRVQLNGVFVSLQELPGKLKMLHQKLPTVTPQLFHDREAYFGIYQQVKQAAESAGFAQLDLVVEPR